MGPILLAISLNMGSRLTRKDGAFCDKTARRNPLQLLRARRFRRHQSNQNQAAACRLVNLKEWNHLGVLGEGSPRHNLQANLVGQEEVVLLDRFRGNLPLASSRLLHRNKGMVSHHKGHSNLLDKMVGLR